MAMFERRENQAVGVICDLLRLMMKHVIRLTGVSDEPLIGDFSSKYSEKINPCISLLMNCHSKLINKPPSQHSIGELMAVLEDK